MWSCMYEVIHRRGRDGYGCRVWMFLLLIKCNIRVSPNKPYSTLEMNLGVLLLNLSGVYSPLVLTHQTHRTRDSNICVSLLRTLIICFTAWRKRENRLHLWGYWCQCYSVHNEKDHFVTCKFCYIWSGKRSNILHFLVIGICILMQNITTAFVVYSVMYTISWTA